ncbi:MAG: 50S ribosomal protein L9, partial [Lachnospira sp.]|nr:50S ribosomal protein L9 [Lachnospira sp.]
MEVILLQDVKSLGKKGQIVKINDGYARNYVLPKKLGLEANAKNLNDLKLEKARRAKHEAEELAAAKELAVKVEAQPVKVTIKTGEGGRTFGSVSSKEIAEAVKEQIRYELRGTVASSHVCDDIGFQRVVPALSLSFYECVENAKDYAWGGAKYNLGNGID